MSDDTDLPPLRQVNDAAIELEAEGGLSIDTITADDIAPPDPHTEAAGLQFDAYTEDCVVLEEFALTDAFIRLSPDIARWGEVHVRARERWMNAKNEASRTRSRRSLALRRALQTNKMAGSKFSEALLGDHVETDPTVIAAEDMVVRSETAMNRARSVLVALIHKGKALISLGADQRADRTTPTGINTKSRG